MLPNFSIEGAMFSGTCEEQKFVFQKLVQNWCVVTGEVVI